MIKRCLPPDLQRAADEAERRKLEAIDKLLKALHGELPDGDDFARQMHALIDADERKDR